MGEIVGAGFLAHVPTIVLPDDERRALNNGNESTLYTGLHQLRTEVFDVLKPDLVIVFDSHWFTTVEFVITSAHSASDTSLQKSCRAACRASPTRQRATPSSPNSWAHRGRHPRLLDHADRQRASTDEVRHRRTSFRSCKAMSRGSRSASARPPNQKTSPPSGASLPRPSRKATAGHPYCLGRAQPHVPHPSHVAQPRGGG